MYEYLEGRVEERGAARLVLDVSGTGYEIFVPVGSNFPETKSGIVRVYTHFAPREDAHHLYGFADQDTRDLFRLLLRANGVGPGLALAVLSGLKRDELLEAVAGEDPKPLVRIKGLGRKRAEQILLDLREKATAMLASPTATRRIRVLPPNESMCLACGYSRRNVVPGTASRSGTSPDRPGSPNSLRMVAGCRPLYWESRTNPSEE